MSSVPCNNSSLSLRTANPLKLPGKPGDFNMPFPKNHVGELCIRNARTAIPSYLIFLENVDRVYTCEQERIERRVYPQHSHEDCGMSY